ncbi:MAG: outer-membrane lipoprotein carrier protein LolA [Pseudomonadota bacterium]
MGLSLFSAVAVVCADIALAGAAALQEAPPPSAVVEEAAVVEEQASDAVVSGEVEPGNGDGALERLSAEADEAKADDQATAAVDPALVFADQSDAAVVETVLDYVRNITTLSGDFTQIAPSGAVSSGTFQLRRPNQLRFEYAPPTPLLIVATQGNVYVRDEDLETTDFYPIRKTPLRFLLSRKVDLDDARVVAVDRGIDTVAVTFASDDAETEGELSVILSAPDLSLQQWVVRDLQGGITIVSLENVVAGEKLANRLFRAPEAGGAFLKN